VVWKTGSFAEIEDVETEVLCPSWTQSLHEDPQGAVRAVAQGYVTPGPAVSVTPGRMCTCGVESLGLRLSLLPERLWLEATVGISY